MAKRRGHGEGTIYRRRDGRWTAAISVGTGDVGLQRRRQVYGRTRAEVAEKLARLQHDAITGMLTEPGALAMGTFLTRWLEDSARSHLRPATSHLYGRLINKHIKPQLGRVLLSKMTPQHLEALYAAMERAGASARLRQMVHALLHRALGQAVRWNLAPRNVADAVGRPRAPRPEIRYLTPEQVVELLKAAKGDPLEALYVLAVTTGMRQGELLGLQWGDVDLERGTLSVRRILSEVAGQLEFADTKTAQSRRRIDLPRVAVEALRRHRTQSGVVPLASAVVFTGSRGALLRKSNLLRRSFWPLLERAKLPRIRFHDLRHTAATLLLAQGVHPKVVQERLGHATIALTLDTYSHVVPSMQRDAADRLDDVLARVADS